MTKWTYDFSEGSKDMRQLLGGKSGNLSDMLQKGIPVPFGFAVTTEACAHYAQHNAFPDDMSEQIAEKIKVIEQKMGTQFGNPDNPLLLSVRSGAAVSMPGMMDTILNLGLNDEVIDGFIKKTDNERFVRDSYRRFIQMFASVVLEVPHDIFEKHLHELKNKAGYTDDTQLTVDDLKLLATQYLEAITEHTGKSFPSEPWQQLHLAIEAVFKSWNNPRAILYRKLNDIRGLQGTGVTVQAMVFGNMGTTSGTGVCFTRNPSTGENEFYGEYLMNAQGEDVVAGIRTPLPLSSLEKQQPQAYKHLCEIRSIVEKEYKDMQDMEFTIQDGVLYILQTRTGKRTAAAAVKIAIDMVNENLIDKQTALLRIDPQSLDQLLHRQIDPDAQGKIKLLAQGLPASPGAAVGEVVFDAAKAHDLVLAGKKVILVRTETSPEDLIGMHAAEGILTARGGMTSHAAVVARGMGKCCVAGCSALNVHEEEGFFLVGETKVTEGEHITLDGSLGKVYLGSVPTIPPTMSDHFETIMQWADEKRTLNIRTNADTPEDARQALEFGAEGIGLCRTEHMFFEGERIFAMRQMILARDEQGRRSALQKLLPYQKQDFKAIFETMAGKPVTIRLLDPPLHEFLPRDIEDKKRLAKEMGVSLDVVDTIIEQLHEQNPMLGHRGCRLGISYPEIIEMQVTAIIEAALETNDENIVPEIMIPLVGNIGEFRHQNQVIRATADALIKKSGKPLRYLVGTMIEVPRATLVAEQIAKEADFFSFGTNDLTQMTYGYSRDDVGSFVPHYLNMNILYHDPFQMLDQEGVGQLITLAVTKGRAAKEELKLGICGEHGGDPSSIEFFHRQGLDYVSCSPFRVPIARLAAAQATLRKTK